MKIHAFAVHYPSLFKPYYDNHFIDLVRSGHELTIHATAPLDPGVSEKVTHHRLLDHVRYLPGASLRETASFTPRLLARVLQRPRHLLQAWRLPYLRRPTRRAHVHHFTRSALLSDARPDLMLVHGHGALHLLPWLKEIYPGAPLALYYYGGIPPEGGSLGTAQTRELLASVDRIFTCSAYSASEVIAQGAPDDAVEVLPLAFDLADFPPVHGRTRREGSRLELVSVGRLSEGKGHQDVLAALSLLSSAGGARVRYTIVGDGPLRSKLESHVRMAGLENSVRFTGAIGNARVLEHLARCDALVLASYSTPNWTETQGTVIQEAMLMGALVVTTRTGGVPDSIPDWMLPYHVPERDSVALAAALKALGALSPGEMARLGGQNAAWVRGRFDVRQFNRKLLASMTALGERSDTVA